MSRGRTSGDRKVGDKKNQRFLRPGGSAGATRTTQTLLEHAPTSRSHKRLSGAHPSTRLPGGRTPCNGKIRRKNGIHWFKRPDSTTRAATTTQSCQNIPPHPTNISSSPAHTPAHIFLAGAYLVVEINYRAEKKEFTGVCDRAARPELPQPHKAVRT